MFAVQSYQLKLAIWLAFGVGCSILLQGCGSSEDYQAGTGSASSYDTDTCACWSSSCDASKPGNSNWKEFIKEINIKRCMHDVPLMTYSMDVYQATADAYDLDDENPWDHATGSDESYNVAAPGGPAGEDLYWSWSSNGGGPSVGDSVNGWYNEVEDCQTLPGCEDGKGGAMVGHFTALIWKNGKELGCLQNSNNAACRFKGSDEGGNGDTPNFGFTEDYEANVPAAVNTEESCRQRIEEKCEGASGRRRILDKTGATQTKLGTPIKKFRDMNGEVQTIIEGIKEGITADDGDSNDTDTDDIDDANNNGNEGNTDGESQTPAVGDLTSGDGLARKVSITADGNVVPQWRRVRV